MVRPCFFLSAPEIAPRTECACQPSTATASGDGGAAFTSEHVDQARELVPWRIGCGDD